MLKIHGKQYLENYARWMLILKFSFSEADLLHADSPDIQDTVNDIGVEVVEDTYEDLKQLERFWVDYQNCRISEIPQRKIDGYKKRGGSLVLSNDTLLEGRFPSKANNPEHLIKTIEGKIDKLNSGNYKKFLHPMLYVFCDTVDLHDSHIQSVIDTVYENSSAMQYERIYIDGFFEIVCCDMKDCKFARAPISQGEQRRKQV